MLPASVFANQRKRVGLVLAVAEIVLLALAFEAAYQTRLHITFERSFFMEGRRQSPFDRVQHTVLARNRRIIADL